VRSPSGPPFPGLTQASEVSGSDLGFSVINSYYLDWDAVRRVISPQCVCGLGSRGRAPGGGAWWSPRGSETDLASQYNINSSKCMKLESHSLQPLQCIAIVNGYWGRLPRLLAAYICAQGPYDREYMLASENRLRCSVMNLYLFFK
jgi:hypothetical protein